MTAATRALWKRRLQYRSRRVRYWRGRGNIPKVNKWLRLFHAAQDKLNPPQKREREHGIDVSGHNRRVDWQQVKASGVDFAFCKTSEGEDWRDKSWSRERVDAMRAAGVRVGVYHFLRPREGRSGAVEARWFMEQAFAAGWGQRGDLLPVIDFEATDLPPLATVVYLRQVVREIKRVLEAAPIIYTGGPFWKEATRDSPHNYGCPLWLAAYVKDPKPYVPRAWHRTGWTIWQYSDKGKISGVSSDNVDRNVAVRLPTI